MGEVVESLPPDMLTKIKLKIWDTCSLEGFNRKHVLQVTRVPSMVINNQICFESLIPDYEELVGVMHKFLTASN